MATEIIFWGSFLLTSLLLCFFGWRTLSQGSTSSSIFGSKITYDASTHWQSSSRDHVLALLVQAGVYDEADFKNELGIVPPYWGSKTHLKPKETTTDDWGPCFAPHERVRWKQEIKKYNGTNPAFHNPARSAAATKQNKNDFASFCRPGFLIIGAGKCGTSSLYHYLTDHPRVLPASEKQVHYFKYYSNRTMKWYLRHFPTSTSFLASGALITGEASPGYLPYPDVAQMVRVRLAESPRIIAIGREPVDRAYSSYRYNYVTPTIKSMRNGRIYGIKPHQEDGYYEPYLFSFEDMMVAELQTLRECLTAPNGSAIAGAKEMWGSQSWVQPEYARREKLGLDPLVDLDGFCYGEPVSKRIIRKQWADLIQKYPGKVIQERNVHLKQSIIGRGLYVLPLEWWYAAFNKSDIYFVCTEELNDMTGEPLNKLGQFLGLPAYNFSKTVSRGAYNVGGHEGYDTEVSWSDLENEHPSNTTDDTALEHEIPLSDAFRRELEEFIRPYNERLFELIGRRCDW